MIYFILKKYFNFLIKDYGFYIAFKIRLGHIQICYKNSQIRILILGQDNIRIFISDVNSLGFDADEYCEEFKINGNYREKAKLASQWLKEKVKEDYCF